jgi:formylglycine-generating enzyme required for sulfatase activity
MHCLAACTIVALSIACENKPADTSAAKPDPHAVESGSQADSLDQQMVLVPAGNSNHADDEKPARSIYLNAFYRDKYEVTVGRYARYLEVTDMEEPSDWNIMNQPLHQRRPVVNVNWEDAGNYCKWAGKGRYARFDADPYGQQFGYGFRCAKTP